MRKVNKLFRTVFIGILMFLIMGAMHAQTNNVIYIDENGVTQTANNVVEITTGGTRTLNTGWYMLRGTQAFAGTITISGTVHLILEDGCGWIVSDGGIRVNGNNNLTIYAQSTGTNMGTLNVIGGNLTAGIGGDGGSYSGGIITINGGSINAIGGSTRGAGIGGGSLSNGGTIKINGGVITAIGTGTGSGIGGCGYTGDGGNITIKGGTVTASSNGSGAGIGGGGQGSAARAAAGGNITISGGTVKATGGSNSAGIGGGGGGGGSASRGGAGSSITISGGVVTAIGTGAGAGIGGGNNAAGGLVFISGGIITANGGVSGGAGIGGGGTIGIIIGGGGVGSNVVITGGSVNAKGGVDAADIGGGYYINNHGTLTNSNLQNVFLNRLTPIGVTNVVPILSTSYGASLYGTKDVQTDENGVLYFYFPVSTNVAVDVSTIYADYGATYTTPNNHNTAIRTLPMTSTQTWTVNITNGTGSGNYAENKNVTIVANTPPTGQRFKEWDITPLVTFINDTKITTSTATFIMPTQSVIASAIYEINTDNEMIIESNSLRAWMRGGLINITGLIVGETLSVYNIMGALVYQGNVISNEENIPLLNKGIYIVRHASNTIKVSNF